MFSYSQSNRESEVKYVNMGRNKMLSQSTHMVLFQPGFCTQFPS